MHLSKTFLSVQIGFQLISKLCKQSIVLRYTWFTLRMTGILISDRAPFNDAFKLEFFTIPNPRTRHIRHIRWQGNHNNNKIGRLNGEVRDREKIMRGLKKFSTPILTGYQIYHNYMRPHEGLGGKTPAER